MRSSTLGNRGYVAQASITINAPAGAVWNALTNPDMIKQYLFGTNVVSDWKKGSSIVWQGQWEGKAYEDKGVILELKPGERIQYSHFSPLSGQPDVPENYHTVTIDVSGGGPQTTVTLSQDNNATNEEREHAAKNWGTMLAGLKQLLER